MALSVLALVMRNYHIILQQESNTEVDPSNLLPTPLSKVKDNDNPYALPTTQDGRAIYPCKLFRYIACYFIICVNYS